MALALAQQLQTFETEEALRALVANAAPLLEVKAPDPTEIREARLTLYRARTGIERQRKALNEDALKWTRQVNARAKDLSAIVSPTEEGLKRIETRLEAEAQDAERRRVDEIEARFAAIGAPGAIPRAILARMSPEDIAGALDSEERRVAQEKAAREAAERARREAEEQRERELAEAREAKAKLERELAEARAALAEQRRRDAEAAAERERLAREAEAPAVFQAPAPPVAVEPVAPPEPEGDLPVTEEVAPEDEPWARIGAAEEPSETARGMRDLFPCPFCGSGAVDESSWEHYGDTVAWQGFVYCVDCEAQGPKITHPYRNAVTRRAAEAWNAAPRREVRDGE